MSNRWSLAATLWRGGRLFVIETTIYNPGNNEHLARIKPAGRRVRILFKGRVIADSASASRLIEIGRDFYDPVLYVPQQDVQADLSAVEGKSTHCPLKGDASYLSLDGEEVAWTYDRPLESSAMLKGLVAFYADKVVVEEIGASA